MKTIRRDEIMDVSKALAALAAAGIKVITARSSMFDGSQVLASRCEILISDESDQASAHAIIDSFDPVQAQAEIEAEEKARAEKAAALEKLADWMQKNPAEATKLLEATAKLAVIETKVAAIEAKVVAVEPKVIPK